jgi:hypothetical protein
VVHDAPNDIQQTRDQTGLLNKLTAGLNQTEPKLTFIIWVPNFQSAREGRTDFPTPVCPVRTRVHPPAFVCKIAFAVLAFLYPQKLK